MGSFYATCSITKSTLGGEPTCLQLIVPRSHTSVIKGYSQEKGLQVSNDGSVADYLPFGFPIRGRYSDYGYICDVERDKNIEKLEEFFGLDIDTIMKCSMDDRELKGKEDNKNYKILEKLSCTYFRTEIYDFMCEGWEDLPSKTPTKKDYEGKYYFGETLDNIRKRLEPKEKIKLPEYLNEKIKNKEKLTEEETDLYDDYRDYLLSSINSFTTASSSYLINYGEDFVLKVGYHPDEFLDDMKKQKTFLNNLGYKGLNYKLVPSQYGSQQYNWKYVMAVNKKFEEITTKIDPENWDWEWEGSDKREGELNELIHSEEEIEETDKIVNDFMGDKNFIYMDKKELRNFLLTIKETQKEL